MSTERGGPFETLLRLVQLGMGGAAGAGTQFISWVHGSDFVRALEYLIRHEDIEGVMNVAAPNPLPNREFMQGLRAAWGMNFGLAAPKWALEFGAVFLGTETELILKSRRVVPGRLLDRGFRFEFPEWGGAARNLRQLWRNRNERSGLQEIRRPARDEGAGL